MTGLHPRKTALRTGLMMSELSLEQTRGTQFEIWLELIFRKLGLEVSRNVEFHKERYVYRQVDLCYDRKRGILGILGKKERIIIEAKYSGRGEIPYKLRQGEKHKSGQLIKKIDNVVDELYERQRFVNARKSYLVTNKRFDSKVRKEAAGKGICLIEGGKLENIYRHLGGCSSLDESIRSIKVAEHDLQKRVCYL